MPECPLSMTVSDLLPRIGTPRCPPVIDVTADADFDADPRLIPGAMRWPHETLPHLLPRLAGQSPVFVCQKGRKLSQVAASWARGENVSARYLVGGMQNWTNTMAAPTLDATALPPRREGRTLWIAPRRSDPGDIAAIWVVRRFVDRSARFLFVDTDQVAAAAEVFSAAHVAPNGLAEFTKTLGLAALELDRRVLVTDAADRGAAWHAGALLRGLATLYDTEEDRSEAALAIFDGLFAQDAPARHEGARR
ncbi:MAG: chromate resistance protein ChrB domain-containing protein [Pseudomonadota bacterium]